MQERDNHQECSAQTILAGLQEKVLNLIVLAIARNKALLHGPHHCSKPVKTVSHLPILSFRKFKSLQPAIDVFAVFVPAVDTAVRLHMHISVLRIRAAL